MVCGVVIHPSCPIHQACEYFVLELTLRAWGVAEEQKRRTLQTSDLATAIAHTDIFDFLVRHRARRPGVQRRGGFQVVSRRVVGGC